MSVEDPYKIVFTRRAIRDLEDVSGSLLGSSPASAPAVMVKVLAAIDWLSMFPHRTVVLEATETGETIRSLPEPPYMIYLAVDDLKRVVRIPRVRHGARRPLKRF